MRVAALRWVQVFVLLLLPALCGCSYLPWPDTFGDVTGPNATRSLNGVAVHRRMWESTGAKILTPQKLSPRLESIDTIVLIGSNYQPPGSLARDWLEDWLAKKSGRTVVYFGRDFDANVMYREDTLNQVAESQRDRAQTQAASLRAQDYVTRNNELREDTFCRWFYLRNSARPTVHEKFSGPWASELAGLDGKWPTGVLLEPPDDELKKKKPTWVTGTKPALVPALGPARSLVVGADGEETLGDKDVQRSIWKADELEDAKDWDAEWELAGGATILLSGNDGAPLVHRITHSKFAGSKILIVANGAPFLNGSLVKPLHRKIGELVIQDCQPSKRIAMLQYDSSGILLSNVATGSETNFGVQALTVWPLSAISLHAALLGIIAFAVLLPILGRPQSLAKRSVTDFGLHVEAMGRMLFESRDLLYGLKATQDYFTKVRRESPPEWLTQMTTYETSARAELEASKQSPTKKINQSAVATVDSATPPIIPPPEQVAATNARPPDQVS